MTKKINLFTNYAALRLCSQNPSNFDKLVILDNERIEALTRALPVLYQNPSIFDKICTLDLESIKKLTSEDALNEYLKKTTLEQYASSQGITLGDRPIVQNMPANVESAVRTLGAELSAHVVKPSSSGEETLKGIKEGASQHVSQVSSAQHSTPHSTPH